jgi:hypothetical protein
MHKLSWKSYVGWAGMILVVALGTLVPVIVRSFGARRATPPELLMDYAILACAIGLGWVLCPTGLGTRSVLTQVVIYLLGAAALAVLNLVTDASVEESVLLYFTIPFLRVTHPSRSPGPSTPMQRVLLALLIFGSVLCAAFYAKLQAWEG